MLAQTSDAEEEKVFERNDKFSQKTCVNILIIKNIFMNKYHISSDFIRGSFFMFVESGCISTNIKFTVP